MTDTCNVVMFQQISIYWKTEVVIDGHNILLVIQWDARHINKNTSLYCKGKVKLSLCLIKNFAMKTEGSG
jgi:hypothetical protein